MNSVHFEVTHGPHGQVGHGHGKNQHYLVVVGALDVRIGLDWPKKCRLALWFGPPKLGEKKPPPYHHMREAQLSHSHFYQYCVIRRLANFVKKQNFDPDSVGGV